LKSFKKLSKLRQAKQLVIVSFNLELRGVLGGRRVRRRLESGRPKRKLKESIVEASAKLLKLYNYSN
jgi:hypothetical protein